MLIYDKNSVVRHWFDIARLDSNQLGYSNCFSFHQPNLANMDPQDSGKGGITTDPVLQNFRLSLRQQKRLGTKRTLLRDFACDEIDQCRSKGIKIVGINSAHYPTLLRAIPGAPKAVYVLGDLPDARRPTVAIVGARKADGAALAISFYLGQQAALSGWSVVSGGAFGCDAAAHAGSTKAGSVGFSISVQAGGLATLYPRHNDSIFEAILQAPGSIISEKPLNLRPMAYDFPIRNRIIAGIADVVVLVQAASKSGASITANLAADYGRDLFVYDGAADDIRFETNHKMILDGASPFRSVEDLRNIWASRFTFNTSFRSTDEND